MDICQIEVEMPAEILNRQIMRQYIQDSYGAVLGSFDPHLLIVNAIPPKVVANESGYVEWDDYYEDLRSRLQAAPSPEQGIRLRSEEHTSELQSLRHLVCRLLLEKKK